jgi:hypothetical protein
MKTYHVTLVYTAYAHYTIEADSEEAAQEQAWAQARDENYGEWDIADVEEVTA